MYNFPKPSELPKPTIDETKVKFSLETVSQNIISANTKGQNSVIADLTSFLNHLEREKVISVITEAGYTVRFIGCYEISWRN